MKFDRRLFRAFATVAAGLFALVACQNATDSNTNSDTPVVAAGQFPISAPRIPDSAAWIFQKDTVVKNPSCPTGSKDSAITCTETFDLPQPLGKDSVALQLWTLGVQTYTVYFKESGSSTTLSFGSASVETLDTFLLSKFADLSATQKAALAPSDTGPSGLVAFYASLILANDDAVTGKPLPVGMSVDSVKKDLVLQGIAGGMSSAQLTALNEGLDTASIRSIAAILVRANLLKTADTLDWFHPVRVSVAAAVSGSLTAGGSAVNVTGAFAWNAGAQVALSRISVRSPDPKDSSNVHLSYQFNLGKTDTTWSLSSSLTIQATSSAAVGWDTLVVTLSVDPTHAATLRLPFQVVAKDVTPPALLVLSLAHDTATVSNSISTFVVGAVATDSGSGVDSLKIGTKAKYTTALYVDTLWDTLYLVVGANVAAVQAWDHAGNTITQSVTITRAPAPVNTKPPTIIHVSPLQDTETVPWSTKSATLSWSITGDTMITSVTLNGHPIAGSTVSAGLYQTSMPLNVGLNVFPLSAVDAYGLTAYDTLRIVRQADTTHPLVVRGAATDDTVLVKSQATYSQVWTVTDNALDSVTINGVAATPGNANTYSTPVTLSGDSLWVPLVAVDSSGNTTRDSIKVRRLSPPSISTGGGTLTGNQTVQVTISSNLGDASLQYSTDKTTWYPYSSAVLISKSQILYARAGLRNVTSEIDSSIFVYTPNFTVPSGPYSSTQTVGIDALGSPPIEDSLSTGNSWTPYTAPLVVSSCTKIFARSKLGGLVSDVVEADYAFAPTLSPSIANDTSLDSQVVTVTAPGADSIQISTDTGATKSWTTLDAGSYAMLTGTLYARTIVGNTTSATGLAVIRLYQKPPAFQTKNGDSTNAYFVTISSSAPSANIYYTADGSVPTSHSTLYTSPIPVHVSSQLNSLHLSAISVKSGLFNSPVASSIFMFTYTPPQPPLPLPPAFSPNPGTFSSPQSVNISCVSSPVTLQYSTDEATWYDYAGPVLVSSSETLYARATSAGGTSITTGAYVITGP